MLQVIQFADLEKVSVKFVRQVLLGLLLSADEEACVEAFSRVPPTPQLALFRESLCMFLHRYVLRNQHQLSAGADAELLTSRAGLAERVLTSADSKVTL